MADVVARHGRIDVLVNNAGIGYMGAVEDIDIDRARATVDTNLWGAVHCMRAVLPHMRNQRDGVIVNVTSVAGRVPGSMYNAFYSASKHGLNSVSEALLAEVEPFGIRVTCIEPGFFATEIMANSDDGRRDPSSPYAADAEWVAKFYDGGVGAGGDPAVVADAIVSAATDPSTPMHVLVGDDAQMFVAMVEQAGSYEGWMQMAVPIVESAAGPRPT